MRVKGGQQDSQRQECGPWALVAWGTAEQWSAHCSRGVHCVEGSGDPFSRSSVKGEGGYLGGEEPPGPGGGGGDALPCSLEVSAALAPQDSQPTLAGALGPDSEVSSYVNVPASPSSKKQLHYLGLELQEAGTGIRGRSPHGSLGPFPPLSCVPTQGPPQSCWVGPRPGHPVQAEAFAGRAGSPGLLSGAGTSHYAQIDLEATAAAHRAGSQHAQAREERLAELEPRRKGALR